MQYYFILLFKFTFIAFTVFVLEFSFFFFALKPNKLLNCYHTGWYCHCYRQALVVSLPQWYILGSHNAVQCPLAVILHNTFWLPDPLACVFPSHTCMILCSHMHVFCSSRVGLKFFKFIFLQQGNPSFWTSSVNDYRTVVYLHQLILACNLSRSDLHDLIDTIN